MKLNRLEEIERAAKELNSSPENDDLANKQEWYNNEEKKEESLLGKRSRPAEL